MVIPADAGKPDKEHTMARKIIIAVTASLFALSATACNTVKGLGQDIESVGDAGDRAI